MNTQLDKQAYWTIGRWGGLACFLWPVALIPASLIYLTGNLRTAIGPLAYSVADFLAGPVSAASLIIVIFAVRERLNEHAPRRMSAALLAGFLAAGAMVLVACIRAANRQYHLLHPDLHLENSTAVLVVWTTLVAGISAAGWHFWGWALGLVGSAGWPSNRLPHGLCILSWLVSLASLFVYAFPNLEGIAGAFSVVWALWLGALLWKTEPENRQAAE